MDKKHRIEEIVGLTMDKLREMVEIGRAHV